MASVLDKLGANPSERYEKLLAEAKRAGQERTFSSRSWRTEFSKIVAGRYPSDERSTTPDSRRIYNYLLNFTSEEVGVIRVLCIGEHAERVYKRRTNLQKETILAKKSGAESKLSRADEIRRVELDNEYQSTLLKIPPDARTVENLTNAIRKPRIYVNSYLRAHPEFAARLIDGDTVLGRPKTG